MTERESSAPIFSDSQRPIVEKVERLRDALRTLEPDDRELFVQTIYAMLESLNTRADKRDKKNKEEIEELEIKLKDKDLEIERLQRIVRQSLQDDEERDATARRFQLRLSALEEERLVSKTATRVEDKVQATAAVGARAVTDLVEVSRRRRDLVRDVVVGLVLAATVLWQIMHERPRVEPTERVPVPHLQQPNPNNPAGMPTP